MAEVLPFRGVRFNPDMIDDIAQVVAPPYDVISESEQEGYYQQHPNNIIRLILGKARSEDHELDNVHSRAGAYFHNWLENKILIRDTQPCFYLTTVEFVIEGQSVTRYGIIGKVRLEHFEKGIILPHERTFSKVKSERLQLMKACHANLSCIFGLYSDQVGIMQFLNMVTTTTAPNLDFMDDRKLHHRVWCIADQTVIDRISKAFRHQKIYIADGHHRYETALNYREWVQSQTLEFSSEHPANFIMMSLSSLEDPGMVIFPAHRLLKNITGEQVKALIERAHAYFDIYSIPAADYCEQALERFKVMMEKHADKNAIGLMSRNPLALNVLIVKENVMDRLFADEFPEPLRVLDVTVLTHLILMKLLNFTPAELDDATKVSYRTTLVDASNAIVNNEADVAFILNPTKIEQVQRVAEHNLIMPRKSTYFYPKVISGLVLNSLKM